ncbi:MAG: glycosyltransferase family 2 protein [Thermoflavifilum sp.]|nr:glycosyltransferase family 2 protein [Thermoflavifilum sp.]MCL6515189.1 glycosyltransferase family 2 protein [Alicyclobacillus sp.]
MPFPAPGVYVPPPVVPVRRRRLTVPAKFALAQTAALVWMVLSIVLSIPWYRDLASMVTAPLALLIIAGIAYIPGYLNVFLMVSVLLDKPPDITRRTPRRPVTLLIAARNEARGLRDTLRYIARQVYDGRVEVILVDNGSTDDTVRVALETAEQLGLALRVVEEPVPGKHRALNTGLRHVQTDLVITVDADTVLHPWAVRHLVARYEAAPPDVAAVAGTVLTRNSRANLWTRMQEWDYFLGIASIKREQGLYQSTLVAQGAFSLYRTDVLREVGGWPDAIGEDIVVTWRVFERGWRVYFEPSAVAFTEVPASLRHFARQRSRWARGMLEGLRAVRPWQQPRPFARFLTGLDLLLPFTDTVYTLCWIPGLVCALFGHYWVVGPLTILVLPITLLTNGVMYLRQRRVFRQLGLRVRRNRLGFVAYVLFYQMIMSPVSVWGYVQELLGMQRRWK